MPIEPIFRRDRIADRSVVTFVDSRLSHSGIVTRESNILNHKNSGHATTFLFRMTRVELPENKMIQSDWTNASRETASILRPGVKHLMFQYRRG